MPKSTTQPTGQPKNGASPEEENIVYIATHDGVFHADEVFAVALLAIYYAKKNKQIGLTRTRNKGDLATYLADPDMWVIDVGGQFEPHIKNCDHHQDGNLQAANMLVFLCIWSEMFSTPVGAKIEEFLEGISDWDTNKDNSLVQYKNSGYKFQTISQTIAAFNREPDNHEQQLVLFSKSLKFAVDILQNEIYKAEQEVAAEQIYDNAIEVTRTCCMFEEFCPIWKSKGEWQYAIMPNPNGWSLNSADSSKYPLPTADELHQAGFNPIFVHTGLFIAVFSSLDEAVEVAETFLK